MNWLSAGRVSKTWHTLQGNAQIRHLRAAIRPPARRPAAVAPAAQLPPSLQGLAHQRCPPTQPCPEPAATHRCRRRGRPASRRAAGRKPAVRRSAAQPAPRLLSRAAPAGAPAPQRDASGGAAAAHPCRHLLRLGPTNRSLRRKRLRGICISEVARRSGASTHVLLADRL